MLGRACTIYLWLFAASIICACGQTSSHDAPEEIDFFQPRELGTWEPTDDGPRVPTGEHPSEDFDWAPDGRPVYFHTVEESERTRSDWQQYMRDLRAADKVALQFKVGTFYNHERDANIERLPEQWPGERGGFWGFGPPFADEYLHMFECPGARVTLYIVRDYIVKCSGPSHVDVYVIADPDASEPPRYSPTDPGRGAPEGLPERWLEWFLEAREGYEASMSVRPIDWNRQERLELFAYAAATDVGISTERLVKVLKWLGSRDYIWSVEVRRIPAEHCLETQLDYPLCKPTRDE